MYEKSKSEKYACSTYFIYLKVRSFLTCLSRIESRKYKKKLRKFSLQQISQFSMEVGRGMVEKSKLFDLAENF